MKVLPQFFAALLVVAVGAPQVWGIQPCCEHHPASPSPMAIHRCGHEQMKEAVPAAAFLSAETCRCRVCLSALPKREKSQIPQITAAAHENAFTPTTSLTSDNSQLYVYAQPPPLDSSARRALLCTFLI